MPLTGTSPPAQRAVAMRKIAATAVISNTRLAPRVVGSPNPNRRRDGRPECTTSIAMNKKIATAAANAHRFRSANGRAQSAHSIQPHRPPPTRTTQSTRHAPAESQRRTSPYLAFDACQSIGGQFYLRSAPRQMVAGAGAQHSAFSPADGTRTMPDPCNVRRSCAARASGKGSGRDSMVSTPSAPCSCSLRSCWP